MKILLRARPKLRIFVNWTLENIPDRQYRVGFINRTKVLNHSTLLRRPPEGLQNAELATVTWAGIICHLFRPAQTTACCLGLFTHFISSHVDLEQCACHYIQAWPRVFWQCFLNRAKTGVLHYKFNCWGFRVNLKLQCHEIFDAHTKKTKK